MIFCDACIDGPRGRLTDSPTIAAGRLRVLTPIATASAGGGSGTPPWIPAGAFAALLSLGAGFLLLRSRATGSEAGSAV